MPKTDNFGEQHNYEVNIPELGPKKDEPVFKESIKVLVKAIIAGSDKIKRKNKRKNRTERI